MTSESRRKLEVDQKRGFTLIEALVVIIVIGILATLIFSAIGAARRSAISTAERAMIRSISVSVSQFEQEFGFLPPLVDDSTPLGPTRQPLIRSDAFLRSDEEPNEPRYSRYSLVFYLMGVLDAPMAGGEPIDGSRGPTFTKPRPDGSFTRSGRAYEPLYDLSRQPERLQRDANDSALVWMNDRWGQPIRYYRWLHDATVQDTDDLNVPADLGDPAAVPELRSARYAIVSMGNPSGGERIVEVGQ